MRKKLFTFLLAVVAGVGSVFASSGTCGDNLTWDLTNGVLTINGTGPMTDYSSYSKVPWYKSTSYITTITINNGVTSIGTYAFFQCKKMSTIDIPGSISKIGGSAFEYCYALTSLTIPDSVISIGVGAFAHCSHLTAITIPNSITSIEDGAFSYCSGLTSVAIPNSVTSIGKYAFSECSSLTSVTIPNSVTGIEYGAFEGCSSLTSVTIPSSVGRIGESAFAICSNLTTINVESTNYGYNSVDGILFNKDNTMLIQYPAGKSNSAYIIPGSVTSIAGRAFQGCQYLKSVTIPNSVTSIGNSVFSCLGVHYIVVKAVLPPAITNVTFCTNDLYYVPNIEVYKKAPYWSNLNLQAIVGVDNLEKSTTAVLNLKHNVWDIDHNYIVSCGISGGEQQPGNVLKYIGLEPNSEYKDISVVLTSNTGETETVNVSFTTTSLELTTKPSKPVSSTTAILLAETNMSDAEVNCGFEWKRNDAPADMDGTKVYCPVANGQMAGRLKNLRDDVYYKCRAFYQSAAGNMYYGDWQYIFTGDVAVEFDPILYTYVATVVKENEATISGYALAGSEDFTEQGFEYWAEERVEGQSDNVQGTMGAPRRMPAALNEHHFVQASGVALRVTLTNLDAGTVYKYRVYGKVGDQYYYGSEQTFTTQGEYVAPSYLITFVNWDGTELQSTQVATGTMPEYNGEMPVRPNDEQYTYIFKGWTPELTEVTADAVYTAEFTSEEATAISNTAVDQPQATKIFRDGQIYILRGDKTYTIHGQEVR